MVDDLEKKMRVHQALHGYADGHRLLASSKTLASRDQKTMLIMSDVSGTGASLDSKGYLTGYPLPDSGVYAIGRTWGATEMPRPGCVWTHTLLLDFADLAVLPAIDFLDTAYRRPSMSQHDRDYSLPLLLERPRGVQSKVVVEELALSNLLAALYGHPKEKVLFDTRDDAADLVFAIWAQQWPRLRRSFRFCTSSFADRSTGGTKFDLQFTSLQDRSYRARFENVIDATRTPFPLYNWLADAIQDITSGSGNLRKFLKAVGGDIAGGREMFAPLCSLHTLIPQFKVDSEFIREAISLIENSFEPSSASSLRSVLVSAVAQHPESIDSNSADFLLKHADLLDTKETAWSHQLAEAIWSFRPEQILSSTADNLVHSEFARSILDGLSTSQILKTANEKPGLMPQLLALKPELLNESEVWSIEGEWAREGLKRSKLNLSRIIEGLLAADRFDLAEQVVDVFGPLSVLRALSQSVSVGTHFHKSKLLSAFMDVCLRDSEAIAQFLGSSVLTHPHFLLEIAYRSYPDYVPNDVGDDPWAIATGKVSGTLDERGQHYLSAYLLARAFGYRSHSQTRLVEFSFDPIYFGALHQKLSDEAWQFLDKALPRSWWYEWDRCQRLRESVVDMFLNRGLPAEGFLAITRDDSLFEELSHLAARNSRGRKYLKKVLRHLDSNKGSSKRVRIIENQI